MKTHLKILINYHNSPQKSTQGHGKNYLWSPSLKTIRLIFHSKILRRLVANYRCIWLWFGGTDIYLMTYPSEPMDIFPQLASFDISKVMKSQWNALDVGFITLSALWFPFNPQPLNISCLPDICESLLMCVVVSGSPVALHTGKWHKTNIKFSSFSLRKKCRTLKLNYAISLSLCNHFKPWLFDMFMRLCCDQIWV